MRVLGWREAALAIMPLAGVLVPSAAAGQAGFYVTPSFSVAEVYDDNVFSAPSRRKTDLISRFSPGIRAGYQSTPLTLLGGYTFDAEVFSKNPELTTAQARQEASLELRSRPTPLLTLGLESVYTETQSPGELNVGTALAVGRVRAQRLAFRPTLAYEFDPLTTGTGDYTFAKDELSGGVSTRAHTASLGLDRRITPRDTGSLGYSFSRFDFDSDETTTSQAFTLGWTRAVASRTQITLRGGARVTEGSPGPEVAASIRHRLERGEVSFAYSRTQTTSIGQAGTISTESFAAAATYRLLADLVVRAAPSFFRDTGRDLEAKVYGMNLDVTYQITQWLSLQGSHAFSFQEGSLSSAGGVSGQDISRQDISRNVLILRLIATYPFRVY